MEVLELPGYTEEEKLKIAKGISLPNRSRNHGLTTEMVSFNDDAIGWSSAVTRVKPASATSSERSPRSFARSRGGAPKAARSR